MKEIWKPIEGYVGDYEVSNLGKVKSLKHSKIKILVNRKTKITNNYTCMSVRLFKNKTSKNKTVHRLVAEAFIPNPENKPFTNHIDNNPSNNNVSNLEWCTQKENMGHAAKQGRMSTELHKKMCLRGINHHNCKLRNSDVLDIIKSTSSTLELSIKYNISRKYVNTLQRRETWKHV